MGGGPSAIAVYPATNLLHDVKIDARGVHIRWEDTCLCGEAPFAVGVRASRLLVEGGTPSARGTLVLKLLQCCGQGVFGVLGGV